ncbi:MAG: ABC transporter substrate-binding protein [Lachnospiraceae bacterium]|nr:ABC transporter substrate-binding protein [Lachnospiraceae bacterium]
MKRFVCVLMAAVTASFLLCGCAGKQGDTLTVLNYGMYIDMNVLDQFEKETGIKVVYEEVPTPEELYTKYKAKAIKYDVVCTSEYMLQRLMDEGELAEVDFSAMNNTKGIGEDYWEMAADFDPGNKHVMPYFWGTVGILYDPEKTGGEIDSWKTLFDGSHAGDIIMQNSMRDAFMAALKYLGYSMNTTDVNELKEAQKLLIDQKKDVQAYLVDEVRDEILAGNAAAGVVYSGEALYACEEDPSLAYCIPKEGTNIWIDCWGITNECVNMANAQKFLDFLCREDIARANFEEVRYSSPVTAINESLTDEEKASEALVPPSKKLANCEIYKNLPVETTDEIGELWKELKAF